MIHPSDAQRFDKLKHYFANVAHWIQSGLDDAALSDRISAYVLGPYRFLIGRNYLPVWSDDVKQTHKFGQAPDAIFYRTDLAVATRVEHILDFRVGVGLTREWIASDHAPVYAKFKLHFANSA